MEAQTAALVEELPTTNHSTVSEDRDTSPQGDATRSIHYPRSATVFAAVASIIFIFVGILGEILICVFLKFSHLKDTRPPSMSPLAT